MGLSSEVQELKNEYKIAQIEAEKATKEAEELTKKLEIAREEKRNKKEYEKDLKKAVENDLITTFNNCFERDGLEKGYLNLSLKVTRDEVLKNVPESDFEWHYINENYERILNKVKKIYENDQKAKSKIYEIEIESQLKQKIVEQGKEQKKEKRIPIYNFLINLFFIFINPITIIIYFLIWGYFAFAVPVLG